MTEKEIFCRHYYPPQLFEELINPGIHCRELDKKRLLRTMKKLRDISYDLPVLPSLAYLLEGGAGIINCGTLHLYHESSEGLEKIEGMLGLP